jgi:hypothetical protein
MHPYSPSRRWLAVPGIGFPQNISIGPNVLDLEDFRDWSFTWSLTTEAREPSSGLVVIPDAFTVRHRAEITALAARYHVPAVYWSRSFAEVGGLISYGPYIVDEYRRAASYADRILHGSKPSELPVQAPVKFELVVNLKTAKALGLDVPPSLLATADEVIEWTDASSSRCSAARLHGRSQRVHNPRDGEW